MSKKGGNDEQNFFETLVNTGFLAPSPDPNITNISNIFKKRTQPRLLAGCVLSYRSPRAYKKEAGERGTLFLKGYRGYANLQPNRKRRTAGSTTHKTAKFKRGINPL